MRHRFAVKTLIAAVAASLALPAVAAADTFNAVGLPDSVGVNTMWVVVAAVLVLDPHQTRG